MPGCTGSRRRRSRLLNGCASRICEYQLVIFFGALYALRPSARIFRGRFTVYGVLGIPALDAASACRPCPTIFPRSSLPALDTAEIGCSENLETAENLERGI
jgi:hypothetical protein